MKEQHVQFNVEREYFKWSGKTLRNSSILNPGWVYWVYQNSVAQTLVDEID